MFLTFDNTVKIGDFGLAITLEAQSKISTETKCGTLCGTPNYIAPEVLMKKGHIRESDYWAIGCMTYALLIGHPPFETDTLKQTYEHILGNVYEVPAEISENAKDFIGKLLHPDPQERGDLEPTSTDSIFNHKFLKTYPKQGPESKKKDIQHVYDFLVNISEMITSESVCEIDRKDIKRTFVKKWIDYSNKFGFGYQLSDNSIGVIFNDGVRMQTRDKKTIVTRDFDGVTKTKYYVGDVPQELKDRNKLLHHFKQYMEENLADPTQKEESNEYTNIHCSGKQITRICLDIAEIKMIHWCRTENCVVMVLSDYSVQINFMSEHYKLIFWQSTDKSANVIVISNHFFHYEAFKKVLCYCSLVLRQVNSLLK